MKIISPLPRKRGRLEIIPLIDIMFFLLAAFMVVSINKIKVDSLKINLPTDVPSPTHETREDFVSISMDGEGQVQIGKQLVTSKDQLTEQLAALYATNHDQKILISGDRDARNGDMMQLLAKIRQAGFQKVAFAIKRESPAAGSPAVLPVPGATPNAPEAPPSAPPASSAPSPSAAPVPSEPAPAASAPKPVPSALSVPPAAPGGQ